MLVGGKTRTDGNGQVTKGWDHDPPAKEKQVPFGILMVVAGALTLLFGSRETSDAWADALQMWWQHVRAFDGDIKRLVIYLDNGPKNWGRGKKRGNENPREGDPGGFKAKVKNLPRSRTLHRGY